MESSCECNHQSHDPSCETWQKIWIILEKRIVEGTGKLCSRISKRTTYEGYNKRSVREKESHTLRYYRRPVETIERKREHLV